MSRAVVMNCIPDPDWQALAREVKMGGGEDPLLMRTGQKFYLKGS